MKLYCPRCGQEQVNNDTRFCSRCGFLMVAVNELVVNNGLIPEKYVKKSGGKNTLKKKGVKKGAMLFLSGILIVPLMAIIFTGIFNTDGFIVGIAALLTFVGGILRMLYALLFEPSETGGTSLEQNVMETSRTLLNKKQTANALPPQQSIQTNAYVPPTAGHWRDTNDLQPSSVTDHTTKLLEDNKK